MQIPDIINRALETAETAIAALAPAALGSAVSQAYQRGLTWGERLVQWVVGITVSHYATLMMTAWLGLGPFATQACSFFIATIAYQATPGFIANASAQVAALPARIGAWIATKTGGQ